MKLSERTITSFVVIIVFVGWTVALPTILATIEAWPVEDSGGFWGAIIGAAATIFAGATAYMIGIGQIKASRLEYMSVRRDTLLSMQERYVAAIQKLNTWIQVLEAAAPNMARSRFNSLMGAYGDPEEFFYTAPVIISSAFSTLSAGEQLQLEIALRKIWVSSGVNIVANTESSIDDFNKSIIDIIEFQQQLKNKQNKVARSLFSIEVSMRNLEEKYLIDVD
jgi:hypothetical protein